MGTPVEYNIDVRIRVIFPRLTKNLPDKDNRRINAVGSFNYVPPKSVSTSSAESVSHIDFKPDTNKEKVKKLKDNLNKLSDKFDRILDLIKKRSSHIAYEYDVELTENEALATAELELFGTQSGRITYEMYEETIRFQEKINKYISHKSIENGGGLNNVA